MLVSGRVTPDYTWQHIGFFAGCQFFQVNDMVFNSRKGIHQFTPPRKMWLLRSVYVYSWLGMVIKMFLEMNDSYNDMLGLYCLKYYLLIPGPRLYSTNIILPLDLSLRNKRWVWFPKQNGDHQMRLQRFQPTNLCVKRHHEVHCWRSKCFLRLVGTWKLRIVTISSFPDEVFRWTTHWLRT